MNATPTETLPIRLSEARLAEEYVDQLRRRSYEEGEKKLMLAVMQEALNNFVQFMPAKDPVGRRRFEEVERWFIENENDWLFSFKNISESIGIDPSYLRAGLLRLKRDRFHRWNRTQTKVRPFRLGRTAYRHRYSPISSARINGSNGRSISREHTARVR